MCTRKRPQHHPYGGLELRRSLWPSRARDDCSSLQYDGESANNAFDELPDAWSNRFVGCLHHLDALLGLAIAAPVSFPSLFPKIRWPRTDMKDDAVA